jgi:hypothetical protein
MFGYHEHVLPWFNIKIIFMNVHIFYSRRERRLDCPFLQGFWNFRSLVTKNATFVQYSRDWARELIIQLNPRPVCPTMLQNFRSCTHDLDPCSAQTRPAKCGCSVVLLSKKKEMRTESINIADVVHLDWVKVNHCIYRWLARALHVSMQKLLIKLM